MVNQTPGQTEYEFDWQNPNYVKPQYEIGRVISRTYQGIFKQWKPIGLAILWFLLVNLVLTFLAYGITGRTGLETDAPSGVLMPLIILITFLSVATSVLGYVFIMAVTDAALFSEYTNRPTTFKALARKALRKTIPLTFGIVLFIIAYYLGILFFIIPGLLVYYGWGVFGPIYVNEDQGLFASFGRSWNLMSGYKRWFFLSNLVIGLINSVIFIAVLFIMMLPLVAVINSSSASSNIGIVYLAVISLGYAFGFIVIAVLTASMTTATYLEVKQLKEDAGHDNLVNVFT